MYVNLESMKSQLNSRYKIWEKLGSGSFGEIYSGENIHTEEKVAIKLESIKAKSHLLFNESKVYNLLAGGVGIPSIKYYGSDNEHNALVMDLLGQSLQSLFTQCNNRFSLKTVLMIADQIITRTEYLHNKNLIHRDIKPENFTIGKGKKQGQIFMIDMGLSKRYCDPINHEHIPFSEDKSLVGTACYTSINSHKGFEQSRRDDIEGIAYVLIRFLRGSLPWQGIKAENRKEKNKKILEMKLSTPIEVLCEGLPCEFADFLREARNLSFCERPDYAGYRKMFRDLFIKEGFIYDYVYDWIENNDQKNLTNNYLQEQPKTQQHYLENEKKRVVFVDPSLLKENTSATQNKMITKSIKTPKLPLSHRNRIKSSLTKPKSKPILKGFLGK